MIRSTGILACLLACVVAPPASLAERPRVYALTGGTVIAAPGTSIDAGTVVIRNGLLEAVGAEVEIPPDAVVIDAAGLWIYPGMIDPDTTVGIEIDDDGASRRGGPGADSGASGPGAPAGAVHPVSRVHPERKALDRLVPFEGDRARLAERYRELGFTVVLAAPDRGVLRGSSVAILLQDDVPVPRLILRDDVAQHVGFERGRFGEGYPTSLMGTAATFRQTLLDAERHALWAERYANDPRGMRRPETVPAFDALAGVLDGETPVVFTVENEGELDLADRLAREFGLRAVISGSGSEWEIADRVAACGWPLILPMAFPDKPAVGEADEALDVPLRRMRRYLEAPSAASRLHDAGVEIAFTTRGLNNLADVPGNLEKIVAAGLPEDVALAALTTVPAGILGVDAAVGTLEAGKIANVVVMDGPLFEKDSKTRRVFIDGVEYRIERRAKPVGDPDAVVDPRGEWSVVFEFGERAVPRTWTIEGERGSFEGTAETRGGTVTFERVELAGNALTVVFPAREGLGAVEITVIVTGDTFDGVAEMGSRTVPVTATRTSGPEGGRP